MSAIPVFKLEEYLTRYEFSAKHLLCCSDAQSFSLSEILEIASPEDKKLWDNLSFKYTEPYGHPLLRERIASSLYPGLSANHILCFAGAEEGIFSALSVICENDDHVIVMTPCYQSLTELPKSKGALVTELVLKEEEEWRINLNEIKNAITAKTKCIIINFPHNPTGQIIDQEELTELVKLCDKHNIWLFSDEVYRLLGTPKKAWAQPAACLYNKALSLGVMSKSFGMPGLRIGWIACQDEALIHKMKLLKDYLSICNSAPAEIISLISLQNKDLILKRNNTIVQENLRLLDVFLKEYQHLFEWVKPQGGCVGFIKYKSSESVDVFCDRLVEEKSVLLMPASIYDHDSNHFRIGYGRKDMPECLDKLEEFLTHENH
ncbi:aminotransferase class I/II-fold pyridoxal phosphate-dependent enzyme [Candidatus Berkiella aquae]|uniref:Aminotransferase class I/II-fold pyridoxal phosphate-dependent enzyme n=1 Tax=Candidatus Berkiella aquae TaxID=295108 RepID=A0A0Q9YPA3_9GAMM|nr:aminotransferase class I/II-fold pyridoxal phosphate-dependent enzyme [Candidatus Berkiella aquae]MCS5711989.1 aminotransferase class I/II-fold pyridoxal phosphate-dependent enzyme [Candidatus Berkiella aquae]